MKARFLPLILGKVTLTFTDMKYVQREIFSTWYARELTAQSEVWASENRHLTVTPC